ncbi:MAG: GTP-binding protein [Euryarchaeota archaeon]|nr:GTP-binding protein [Euryarchaeota archaeon]
MRRNKETKIVIFGSYNSGKTTTLDNLCEKKTKVEYNGTTIALDYGNTVIKGEKVHVFGSPGQERFKFMREILSEDLDGAIVVIDNSKGLSTTDNKIIRNLKDNSIPYVIFANKQDLKPCDYELNSMFDVPIIPTVAKQGEGIQQGLEKLLHLVKRRGVNNFPKN